jgi:hypothetical protein
MTLDDEVISKLKRISFLEMAELFNAFTLPHNTTNSVTGIITFFKQHSWTIDEYSYHEHMIRQEKYYNHNR